MSKLAIPKHISIEEFLTEEEKVLREATRGFVEGVIMPIRQQLDADEREHKIIEPVIKQILVDFGAQRMIFSREIWRAKSYLHAESLLGWRRTC